MGADLPFILASIFESIPGLADLRFYPNILRIFKGDEIFLETYFFKKNLGLYLGNYRKSSGKF